MNNAMELTDAQVMDIRQALADAVSYGLKLKGNIDWCLNNSSHGAEEDDELRATYFSNLRDTLVQIKSYIQHRPIKENWPATSDTEINSAFDTIEQLIPQIEMGEIMLLKIPVTIAQE